MRGLVEYPLQLNDGIAYVRLPSDVKDEEIDRVIAMLRALKFNEVSSFNEERDAAAEADWRVDRHV